MSANTLSSKNQQQEQYLGISTMLAFALLPLSGFATDIYIPSLPSMAEALNANSVQVQVTLSLFLISYGLSQLFIGSVLDSFGRYKIGLVSLLLFALSSIVIAQSHNLYLIYLMRIVHGLTVGGVVVAKRAFFVDVFSGEKLKHYLSLFTIIWSTGPIVAPFIGGYLQEHFGWESNFYFLAAFALVIAVLEFIFSGETLRQATSFQLGKIVRIYTGMIRTSSFMMGILMLGFAYSMIMVYNMTGPFIIEHHLGFTPIVAGYSSLILGFAWMVGGFIGKATINRPLIKKMVINVSVQLLFALLMISSKNLIANLYSLICFAFIIHVGAGYTYNNYFTYCLSKFPHNAGIAGGLTGGFAYIIVSLLSYVVLSLLPAQDQSNLAYSYLILIAGSIGIMYGIFRLSKKA